MPRTVTFQGSLLTLVDPALKIGDSAPSFEVATQELKPVQLSDFKGKIKVITSFPSLDTPVCDLQVKEFNKKVTGFSSDVVVLGISMDLPFAQKRFCDENNIKGVHIFSDYNSRSFGINYGLLIKELSLLARAALIVDKNDRLRYIQIAPELTHALKFDEVYKELERVIA